MRSTGLVSFSITVSHLGFQLFTVVFVSGPQKFVDLRWIASCVFLLLERLNVWRDVFIVTNVLKIFSATTVFHLLHCYTLRDHLLDSKLAVSEFIGAVYWTGGVERAQFLLECSYLIMCLVDWLFYWWKFNKECAIPVVQFDVFSQWLFNHNVTSTVI